MLAAMLVLVVAAADDAQLARGKSLFLERCSTCHGIVGKGDGVTAKVLRPAPADLTAARFAKTKVEQVLWYGVEGTAMGAQRDLRPIDRDALVAFVVSLGSEAAKVPAPALVEEGRDLFVIRCAVCHGESADGTGQARARFSRPPADFTEKQPSRARIKLVLENGVAGTAMTPMRSLLTEHDVEALIAFIQASFGQGARGGVPPRP